MLLLLHGTAAVKCFLCLTNSLTCEHSARCEGVSCIKATGLIGKRHELQRFCSKSFFAFASSRYNVVFFFISSEISGTKLRVTLLACSQQQWDEYGCQSGYYQHKRLDGDMPEVSRNATPDGISRYQLRNQGGDGDISMTFCTCTNDFCNSASRNVLLPVLLALALLLLIVTL